MTNNLKERFKELYLQGLTDKEISDNLNLSIIYISIWRNINNLPNNYTGKTKTIVTPAKLNEIEKLYLIGYSDSYIARKLRLPVDYIFTWRKFNLLRTNIDYNRYKHSCKGIEHIGTGEHSSLKKEMEKHILNLYNKGLHDDEISAKLHISPKKIEYWRHKNKLPINKYKKHESI